MSLHILGGLESIRVFADHAQAKPHFVGHRNVEYGSQNYYRLIRDAQASGCGVFFSVNRTDGKGAKAENIKQVRTFYVDIDGLEDKTDALLELMTARLKPSAIVETKNGVHAYWYARPEQGVRFKTYGDVQRGLIRKFNGDKSAKDIARVLRIPGTMHLKDPAHPYEVRLIHQLPKEETPYYTPEEILEAYPAPTERTIEVVPVTNSPAAWKMLLEDLEAWSPVPGERNATMLLCAGVAIRYGVSQEKYISDMLDIVKSWRIGRNELAELRRVASWAYAKGNAIPASVLRKKGVPIRREL